MSNTPTTRLRHASDFPHLGSGGFEQPTELCRGEQDRHQLQGHDFEDKHVVLPYAFECSTLTLVGASTNDCVRDHKNTDLPASVPVIGCQACKIENSSRENQGLLKDWPPCGHYSHPR